MRPAGTARWKRPRLKPGFSVNRTPCLRRPAAVLASIPCRGFASNCQVLWMRFCAQGATDPVSVTAGSVSAGLLSCSLPSMKVAPALTRGTSSGPALGGSWPEHAQDEMGSVERLCRIITEVSSEVSEAKREVAAD